VRPRTCEIRDDAAGLVEAKIETLSLAFGKAVRQAQSAEATLVRQSSAGAAHLRLALVIRQPYAGRNAAVPSPASDRRRRK